MKKLFKILSVFTIIIVCSFVMIKVFADNKIEVKEYVNGSSYSAVLYSNNKLYLWGAFDTNDIKSNIVIDNIIDIYGNTDDLIFLDNENNLKTVYFRSNYNLNTDEYEEELVITDKLKTNVKKIDKNHILTKDNKLYKYVVNTYNENAYYEETLIMENVKDWGYYSCDYNDYYLIIDNDDNLYAYGYNMYGKKINDGENITETPIKIAENVKEIQKEKGYDYDNLSYITKDNELYIVSKKLPYPKLLKKNVSSYLPDKYYVSEGKTYYIYYVIEDDKIDIRKDELILNEEVTYIANEEYGPAFYLTKNGNVYDYKYQKIYSNVVQLHYGYSDELGNINIIKEDGTLSEIKYSIYYNPENNYDHDYIYEENKKLINVKKIIDKETLIMKDDTIYIIGYDYYYDVADFNNINAGKDYENFAVIKGLPNVQEDTTISQITLHHNNKTHFNEGNTADYYVSVYPNNVADKEIIWTSSDETVATVSQQGTLKFLKEGTTTIKVKAKNLNVYDEITITVHPKNTGLQILGDEEIEVNTYDYNLLTVKITPDNTYEQKIKWTTDAGKDSHGNDIITFYGINEEYNTCYSDACPTKYNEIGFYAENPGVYTITATTEDGLYSDSIKVNVEQAITSLSPNPGTDHLLGSTLYIYMKESKTMDLNVKIYPETATDRELIYTSSDESIATVDETGKVTAKKAGKVTITIKAKNTDVERKINILIFDETVSTKLGDVDGDGIVDILDVVKIRRHVAGVEALQ